MKKEETTTWKKVTKRHARSSQYDYFLQGPKSRRLHATNQTLIQMLRREFGNDTRWETRVGDKGYTMSFCIENKNWLIDRHRGRIYITEAALTIFTLKYL